MATEKQSRIYSRRGDLGETSLRFGPRVGKDQNRIVACGNLDELNSWLGLIRADGVGKKCDTLLFEIQNKIFDVCGELTALTPARHQVKMIIDEDVQYLENCIDELNATLPPLRTFLIPGGSRAAAQLQIARSICRRAERRIVALIRKDPTVSPRIIAWINRLGDLLFVLSRVENQRHQISDTHWLISPPEDR